MINGEETSVIVDDLFPVKDDKFLYCQVDEISKLWVPLIEKAWAKSHSGYSNIEYGRSSECLRDLTGAPAFEYETTDPDIIEHIQYAYIENFVMTTHSDSSIDNYDKKEIAAKYGIRSDHCYALINLINYDSDEMVPTQMVQL